MPPDMHAEIDIPLTRPDLNRADLDAMVQSGSAGEITQGRVAERFETAFADAIGAVGGVATQSATSAIVLALRVLGVGSGDEVILPSYTCLAVLHAVIQSGATPVLVDNSCDPAEMDYNLGPAHVAAAIGKRTAAIIVPHMFGVAAEIDAIRQFKLPVIEDITLSVGAQTRSGRPVGSMGDLAVCSFHASKMLTTGEGGMLLANDPGLLSSARELNNWVDNQVAHRFGGEVEAYSLRYNFRLSDIHAACGLSQLSRLAEFIQTRRALAHRYAIELQGLDGVELPNVALAGRVYFRFMVYVKNRDIVDILQEFGQFGIEAGRGVYPPLHHFLGLGKTAFPGAEKAACGTLSIPLYPALNDDEIGRILAAAKSVLGA